MQDLSHLKYYMPSAIAIICVGIHAIFYENYLQLVCMGAMSLFAGMSINYNLMGRVGTYGIILLLIIINSINIYLFVIGNLSGYINTIIINTCLLHRIGHHISIYLGEDTYQSI